MAYIGNKLADSYTSFAKQDFTTSATTSYTLDYPVANANEIALFINFVRQEPTTAYTATGTSLTLTSATSASDDMYCVFLGKALQTVNPPAGSVGLSQLSATGTASASTYLRGDNSWGAISVGDNTPAFEAYLSASQSVSHNTITKVQLNTEVVDTDSCYDNSTNYRFTPTTAGKYYVYGSIAGYTGNTTDNLWISAYIRKNGSNYREGRFNMNSNYGEYMPAFVHAIVDMNGSTDYLELFGLSYAADSSGNSFEAHTKSTYFGAYKLNGV